MKTKNNNKPVAKKYYNLGGFYFKAKNYFNATLAYYLLFGSKSYTAKELHDTIGFDINQFRDAEKIIKELD